uniref:FHF complex subunit HOOK interacting protein 1A n=1 Tax=Leptobrachium leishanense TaxID=445787 RepID=A0A8C5QL51_9ANUR
MSQEASVGNKRPSLSLQGVDPETCTIVFKNHWFQVHRILEKHDPFKNTHIKIGKISQDEISTVQNYVEYMLLLLIEEQVKDEAMGPILEFVVSENIMEKLFLWSLRREFSDETKYEQLKMYELLVTQSHQPLLHHKPILKPLMMLLSTCSGILSPKVEMELVILLNQLCSILAKDPFILELFFHTSEDQGAANFLIFSLLIPFIHREGTVGQQARDALLFIMSLSAENIDVAKHIVESTFFCPVLATGLSGLYSSLPTRLDAKGEEWHCIVKSDWVEIPALIQFLNSLEFCNAVVQVAHHLIRVQLVDYIYMGFLLPVLAPALHKVTVEEVMTTTAYLDLFLRSITEPTLLKIFLRFILMHEHEQVHILDTLVSRINTPFRLCVVSLALFRTLIGLHCEDVMLQLILRYLIPCNHMMVSQRSAVKERDCYSASAARFLALTPECCSRNSPIISGSMEKNDVRLSKLRHKKDPGVSMEIFSTPEKTESSIIETGENPVDASYLDYLWEAHENILKCAEDCEVWSAPYDGVNPDPDISFQALFESSIKRGEFPTFRRTNDTNTGSFSSETISLSARTQIDLEWDDSYDTGISPDSGNSSPQPPETLDNSVLPPEPPLHIQEMKKSAIKLIKESYIEDSDFQDDVMVYRLCAEKDAHDTETEVESNKDSSTKNFEHGSETKPLLFDTKTGSTNRKHISLNQETSNKRVKQNQDKTVLSKLKLGPSSSSECKSNEKILSPDSEDFIARCDEIMKGMSPTSVKEWISPIPSIVPPIEDDDDEEEFEKYSLGTPAAERAASPFEPQDAAVFSNYSPRTQALPFTGPFTSVVLSKLENMLENSMHVNLLLIEIITHLATFPQPLIRSFLLNTNMVFQPSVRSLYQVLASVKHKIEQFSAREQNFQPLLGEAQQNLFTRMALPCQSEETLSKGHVQMDESNKSINAEASQSLLQKNKNQGSKSSPSLSGVPETTKNAVYAAILYPEFLKELAALAQEQSILYNVAGGYIKR